MVLDIRKIIKKKVNPLLINLRSYKTKYESPRIKSLVVNTCLGTELSKSEKLYEKSAEILFSITLQTPKILRAKKSVSNFKLREGDFIALICNLHYFKMYRLLTNLLFLSLPQPEEWFSKRRKVDCNGNLNFGIDEHLIFPEIGFAYSGKTFGLNININFYKIKNTKDNVIFLKMLMLI